MIHYVTNATVAFGDLMLLVEHRAFKRIVSAVLWRFLGEHWLTWVN